MEKKIDWQIEEGERRYCFFIEARIKQKITVFFGAKIMNVFYSFFVEEIKDELAG